MKLEVKNKRKSTRGGISLETATIVVTDAILDLSLFTDDSTPGVRVSLSSATDTVARYKVEVIGRRNVGIDETAEAILASLRGDNSAIQAKLGVPRI